MEGWMNGWVGGWVGRSRRAAHCAASSSRCLGVRPAQLSKVSIAPTYLVLESGSPHFEGTLGWAGLHGTSSGVGAFGPPGRVGTLRALRPGGPAGRWRGRHRGKRRLIPADVRFGAHRTVAAHLRGAAVGKDEVAQIPAERVPPALAAADLTHARHRAGGGHHYAGRGERGWQ